MHLHLYYVQISHVRVSEKFLVCTPWTNFIKMFKYFWPNVCFLSILNLLKILNRVSIPNHRTASYYRLKTCKNIVIFQYECYWLNYICLLLTEVLSI